MKAFLAFWKKDIINKLIVLVSLGLVVGIGAIGWLIFHMPEGRSLTAVFADFLPATATPAFDPSKLFTPGASSLTPTTVAHQPATSTPIPLPTSTPTELVEATPTLAEVTETPLPSPIPKDDFACLPADSRRQQGRVLEILDGVTIRVLIDGFVYPVRYAGLVAPADRAFGDAARYKNGELVYGRDVVLIEDPTSPESEGRLLRYVMIDKTFVNLELVHAGLASVLDVSPAFSCLTVFKDAEQVARKNGVGMWVLSMTPTSP